MAKGLGKSAVILTASKIITTLMSLVTAMLLARFRTLEEYGTYSQLLIVINLATSLFMLGLPNSTNYFLARCDTHEERQRFLSVYYTLNTLLCFITGAVLAFAVPGIIAYFDNQLVGEFTYFLVVFPWVSVILGSISNVLVVYEKTGKLMVFNVVNAATTLLTVLFVQAMGWSFREYMLIFLLVDVLLMAWVYAIVWNLEKPLYPSLDRRMVSQIMRYSVPIGLAGLVGTVSIEVDKLLIGWFFDTEQLAIYTNAAKELPLSMVASSLTAVLLPSLARMLKEGYNEDAVRLWGVATELSFIVIAAVVFVVFAFAEEAMEVLYSAKYLPGVPVFRVYTLVLLLRVTYFGMVLSACGETKKILYCSVLTLVLNVVLSPVFYFAFGMIGPAVATFAVILAIQLLQLQMTARAIGISFSRIFPWARTGKLLLLNASFALVFFLARYMLPLEQYIGQVSEALVLGALWLFIYCVLMKEKTLRLWRLLNRDVERSIESVSE